MNTKALVFGYGAIMHPDDMQQLAPNAEFVGAGRLPNHRIGVTRSGWLGITPEPGTVVHGAIYRMGRGDENRLDAFEAIDRGLYVKRYFPVESSQGEVMALVYEPTEPLDGEIRPEYLERCIDAARTIGLPEEWLNTLCVMRPKR